MTRPVLLARSPVAIPERQLAAAMPSVGIFWGVMWGSVPMILHDGTALAHAEDYDLCKSHPRDHHSVWEASKQRLGLLDEYDDHPRGRIVFDSRGERFVVYLDPQLEAPAFQRAVLHYFALPPGTTFFRRDAHYSRARHRLTLVEI